MTDNDVINVRIVPNTVRCRGCGLDLVVNSRGVSGWHLCPGPCIPSGRHLGVTRKTRRFLFWQWDVKNCDRCHNLSDWSNFRRRRRPRNWAKYLRQN